MRSTHTTLIAYAKGTVTVFVMAAGTALLMAWGGSASGLQDYSSERLEVAAQTVPEQLTRLDTERHR